MSSSCSKKSFDDYFGTFPGANGATMRHSANPPTHDPNHTHKGWLKPSTRAVRQQFLESDIPTYFAYGRQFSLCDNYFTDVAGPFTPNHLMLLTADSPVIDNPSGNPIYDLPSLPANSSKREVRLRADRLRTQTVEAARVSGRRS